MSIMKASFEKWAVEELGADITPGENVSYRDPLTLAAWLGFYHAANITAKLFISAGALEHGGRSNETLH